MKTKEFFFYFTIHTHTQVIEYAHNHYWHTIKCFSPLFKHHIQICEVIKSTWLPQTQQRRLHSVTETDRTTRSASGPGSIHHLKDPSLAASSQELPWSSRTVGKSAVIVCFSGIPGPSFLSPSPYAICPALLSPGFLVCRYTAPGNQVSKFFS